ncbi:ABC transporter permease DevC [Spirulina major]|uniref:ABC transporter permease DevC n=1 Tax=Spirulina major TaxID=270636 RepID=UPI000933F341|nr:ABC transporter permease DevC [Spirulina major]
MLKTLRRRTWLGWLQLSHEPSRLLVALAGIAFADVLMFMQLGFQASLFDSNTRIARSFKADVILVSPKAKNTQNLSTFSRRRIYQALDVPGVRHGIPLYSSILTWKNPQTRQDTLIQLVGFDPDDRVFELPDLNAQQDRLKLPDHVIFDRRSRGQYGEVLATVDSGQIVTTEAEGRTLTITGLFSLGASFGTDGMLMASDQTFLQIFPRRNVGSISLGLLQLEPGADPDAIAAQLRTLLPSDVNVLTQTEFIAAEQNYWQRESPIGFIFTMGTAMAFIVGVVIVYQVLSTDVNAHLQEYATFKAMGYRHAYLLGVIFEEAVILAVLGFVPGFVLPLGLYRMAANATALPIAMTVHRAVVVFGLTLVMCLMSGAIATRRLQAADPADMF